MNLAFTKAEKTYLFLTENDLVKKVVVINANEEKGRFYKARITELVPSLGGAFAIYGAKQKGFFKTEGITKKDVISTSLSNTDKLNVGDNILLQVVRNAMGDKGALLSAKPALDGEYFSFTPLKPGIRLEKGFSESEKQATYQKIKKLFKGDICLTVNKNAFNASDSELLLEYDFLTKFWEEIKSKYSTLLTGEMVSSAVVMPLDGIVVCKDSLTEKVVKESFSTAQTEVSSAPFEVYEELLFARKIKLDCGGEIVIDKTEAMTVIDVNSLSLRGGKDEEDTALTVDLEASDKILQLLKIRDITGIIVIDYIKLKDKQNRQAVFDRINDKADEDLKAIGWTKLGLMELTRRN